MKKRHLTLIKNGASTTERIQARIDDFLLDLYAEDGEMSDLEDVMIAIHDYLCDFEDPNLYQSAIKIKESIFYIAEFMRT